MQKKKCIKIGVKKIMSGGFRLPKPFGSWGSWSPTLPTGAPRQAPVCFGLNTLANWLVVLNQARINLYVAIHYGFSVQKRVAHLLFQYGNFFFFGGGGWGGGGGGGGGHSILLIAIRPAFQIFFGKEVCFLANDMQTLPPKTEPF